MIPEKSLVESCKNMRKNMIQLTYDRGKKGAHIAPSLSLTEIMGTLFLLQMNHDEDLFVLSKGHGGLCYYTALYEARIITKSQLYSFEEDGGKFPGQPSLNREFGIVYPSGSLGMGLSYAIGRAVGFKKKCCKGKVYVVLGDGESNEGSVWEGAMLAKQLKLNNLIVVIDNNGMQSDGQCNRIIDVNHEAVWRAFGWDVRVANGHNVESIINSMKNINASIPTVIIAKTIKGKGVSFMENNHEWHHASLTMEQYEQAMGEIESGY